jgi:hypothetical protein
MMSLFKAGRSRVPALAAILLLCLSLPARAEDVAPSAAQRLFDEARNLMAVSRFAEACPKLEESQRLDPATGTLLNVALCHEKLGKSASAWLEYHQAAGLALRESDTERWKIAGERIAVLEPLLSRLRVQWAEPIPAGSWLTLDGQQLGPESWKTDVPVDPGRHEIRFGAPRKLERSVTIDVVDPASTQTVSLPALRSAPPPSPKIAGESEISSSKRKPTARIGWLLTGASFGVAASALGTMTYFGLRSKNAWDERDRHCESRCDVRAVEFGQSAHDFARAADVALGLSVLGAGLGSYFLFTTLEGDKAPVGVTASIGSKDMSLTLRGSL